MFLEMHEQESTKQKPNHRSCEYSYVNKRNPRLIVDVKLFEIQAPWVFYYDPPKHIENNANPRPYGACY